jgi:hypothetical protein
MMANDAVRVELPERACVVALGHFRLDGSPLQPEWRAAILRSAESAYGHVQTVTCTRAEAEDLLDYFAQAIQVLSRVATASACVLESPREGRGGDPRFGSFTSGGVGLTLGQLGWPPMSAVTYTGEQ